MIYYILTQNKALKKKDYIITVDSKLKNRNYSLFAQNIKIFQQFHIQFFHVSIKITFFFYNFIFLTKSTIELNYCYLFTNLLLINYYYYYCGRHY